MLIIYYVHVGQLVLVKLSKEDAETYLRDTLMGIVMSKLGSKRPQNYEVYADNDIWIATENNLELAENSPIGDEKPVSLN